MHDLSNHWPAPSNIDRYYFIKKHLITSGHPIQSNSIQFNPIHISVKYPKHIGMIWGDHLPIISPMFEYVWGVLLIFLINHHQIPSPQFSLNYGRYTADSSTFISHIPTIFHIFSTHPLAKNLSGATQGDGSELVGRHQGMGQNWRPWGTIDLQ